MVYYTGWRETRKKNPGDRESFHPHDNPKSNPQQGLRVEKNGFVEATTAFSYDPGGEGDVGPCFKRDLRFRKKKKALPIKGNKPRRASRGRWTRRKKGCSGAQKKGQGIPGSLILEVSTGGGGEKKGRFPQLGNWQSASNEVLSPWAGSQPTGSGMVVRDKNRLAKRRTCGVAPKRTHLRKINHLAQHGQAKRARVHAAKNGR